MYLLPNHIDLCNIQPELLADRYYNEYQSFLDLGQFTNYTNPDIILKVFDALFHQKYMKTDIYGNRRWDLGKKNSL